MIQRMIKKSKVNSLLQDQWSSNDLNILKLIKLFKEKVFFLKKKILLTIIIK